MKQIGAIDGFYVHVSVDDVGLSLSKSDMSLLSLRLQKIAAFF